MKHSFLATIKMKRVRVTHYCVVTWNFHSSQLWNAKASQKSQQEEEEEEENTQTYDRVTRDQKYNI